MTLAPRPSQLVLVIAVTAIGAGLLFVFGWTGYPPTGKDATGLVPAAISKAAGKGFADPVFEPAWRVDGTARFIYHGPLYPLLLSALMPHANSVSALRVIAGFNVAILILCSLLFWRAAVDRNGDFNWSSALMIVLALGTTSAYLIAGIGRPDTFAVLVMTIGALAVWAFRGNKIEPILWGIGLGLLAASHPVAFLEACAVLGIYVFSRHPARRGLLLMIAAALPAAIVFGAFFWLWYPYPFGDWLRGMAATSRIATGGWAPATFPGNWLLHPVVPFMALLWGVAIFQFIRHARVVRHQVKSPWLVAGCGVLLGAIVFHFAVQVSYRIYNVFPLMPLLLAGMIWFSRSRLDEQRPSAKMSSRWVCAGIACLVATNVGLCRIVLLFPYYLNRGVTLAEARREYAAWEANHPTGMVAITDSLWTLSENYSRMRTMDDFSDHGRALAMHVVRQQYNYGALAPPPLELFALDENYYRDAPPRLFGLKLARTMPGYQFATYDLQAALATPKNPAP